MNVIRGAITIDKDEPIQIKEKTAELLKNIQEKNGLQVSQIQAVIFSTTQDIHSYYPAKAARECGFDSPALFSCVEPNIDGALALCIRVMLFVDGEKTNVNHVYLGKAAALRKDITSKIVIALDGPAGSGKSTIAKALASSYNILYLDTGAMYRACALKLLRAGVSPEDEENAEKIIKNTVVSVKYENGAQRTLLDGEDVSTEIRKNEVSMLASTTSKLRLVREKMVEAQRAIAGEQSCVLDGRDIGTVVLPNAPFKFFVTASSQVRAMRRWKELQEKGETNIELESLRLEIEARDKQDATRAISPLRQADDAILVDTSAMTIDEVVNHIRSKIQEKI